ncbi:hypothetical protein [Stenotrophomonas maltophilia]
MSRYTRHKVPALFADTINRNSDLQRIDEALSTVESIADLWLEHHRLKPCPPGLLLSLNRLLDFTSLAKAYAIALRAVDED